MQALILAGGLGTRLRPLTHTTPKCLVPVAGKPFLEHVIQYLKRQGICDLILTVGYRSEQIQDYFKAGSSWGVRIQYSVENPPRGTGGALRLAREFLKDSFFVLNGDNLIDCDLSAMRHVLAKNPGALGVLAVNSDPRGRFDKNVTWDGVSGRINCYQYQNAQGKNYVDIGIKLFNKKILEQLPSTDVFSLEKDVLENLSAQGLLAAFNCSSDPIEIGNAEQLEEAEKRLKGMAVNGS